MLILRPVKFSDLQGIERLAVVCGGRLTTLPANRDYLSELISRSTRSVQVRVDKPGGESYHFAMEDTETGSIVGIAGIEAAVGLNSPFYSYRISDVVQASAELQIHNRIPALHLCQDYIGASRLYTLFLEDDFRSPDSLRLLSLSRLMFMAAHPERFASRLIAELQGVTDGQGKSPFWENLGRHFFSMELRKAVYLTGIDSKSFIADLLPQHPVYLPLLGKSARAALGRPRKDAAEVLELLEGQGFTYRNYVDIFDAGPTLEAPTHMLKVMAESRLMPLAVRDEAGNTDGGRPALVSNDGLQDYCCLKVMLNTTEPALNRPAAEVLGLTDGSQARVYWLD